jgi:hypothetical protein
MEEMTISSELLFIVSSDSISREALFILLRKATPFLL